MLQHLVFLFPQPLPGAGEVPFDIEPVLFSKFNYFFNLADRLFIVGRKAKRVELCSNGGS
jgi:hypothetical protein